MPQVEEHSLDLLTCSPAHYHCTAADPYTIAGKSFGVTIQWQFCGQQCMTIDFCTLTDKGMTYADGMQTPIGASFGISIRHHFGTWPKLSNSQKTTDVPRSSA